MAFEVSVFLENRITHLEGITNQLKLEQINIRSFTLTGMMHGWGVLNLLVDKPEKAYQVLAAKGNSVALREVIALEMKDEAGGLDELLVRIARAGIHVENANTRLLPQSGKAILLLDVSDVIEAKKLLSRDNISVMNDAAVYGL